jgi:hypothetical protein
MPYRLPLLILVALTLLVWAPAAHAQSNDLGVPDIMRPEPWLPPKYKSPRVTPERVVIPRPTPAPQPRVAAPPPPIYVPETGRLLPNMPAVSPSGPGGRETYQDRAIRCVHQAGSYGAQAGDRNSYIGACINQ